MEFCPTLLEDHPWRQSRDPSSGILQYLTEALSPEDAPPRTLLGWRLPARGSEGP